MHTISTPPAYTAVRHILRAPPIARRTEAYIRPDGFDWDGLGREASTMSGGEALLVRIARELWTAEKLTALPDIPGRLDERNFERVIEALVLCRGTSAAPFLALLLAEGNEGGGLAA
jgi:hypothetical protein